MEGLLWMDGWMDSKDYLEMKKRLFLTTAMGSPGCHNFRAGHSRSFFSCIKNSLSFRIILVALMNMKKKKPEKILIVTGVRIGDQLMATPFFRAVRRSYPRAKITVATGRPALDILRHNRNFDELIAIDRKIYRTVAGKGPFDLAIDLCGSAETAFLTVASGAAERLGNRYVGLPGARPDLYTTVVGRCSRSLSFLDRYLFFAGQIGVKPRGRQTELFLTDRELETADKIFTKNQLGRRDFIMGIFPSGSRASILWAPEKYGRLADKIAGSFKVKVLFFADKPEKHDLAAALARMRHPYVFAGFHDIRTVAALISRCDAVVAPNRGPLHIAAALKIPTISVFGPYSEKEFCPYPPKQNLTVFKKISCRPCGMGYKQCPRHIACLDSLTVGEAWNKTKPFLTRLLREKYTR